MPGLRLSIVPDEVAPVYTLSERPGIRGLTRWYWSAISVPGVVYALAPGGSGERAGLEVGDRILETDGPSESWLLDASVGLRVQRGDRIFEVTVKREQVEGTVRFFA